LLRLRLTEIFALAGIDHDNAYRMLLAFVPSLEADGDPEMCYLAYERLAHFLTQFGNPEAVAWAEKAIDSAHKIGLELFSKQAEASALWIRVDLGLYDEATEAQLLTLLAECEQAVPDSLTVYGLLWSLSTAYASRQAYEHALAYGQRALTVAIKAQSLYWLSHATHKLADISMEMGRPDEAARQLIDQLDWHLGLGQVWQTLGTLWSISVYQRNLFPDLETAVAITSMVYHHPEVVPTYIKRIDEARPHFLAEMEPDAFSLAWDRGKKLDFETAVAQMRAALGTAGS
jgi:tetratricopeptide (TPR) repeat protein